MEIVGYSAARQRLAKPMDSVVEEYEATAETLHRLRSPKSARRLHKTTRDADAGRFVRSPRG